MVVRVNAITFDTVDPVRLAAFWSQVTEFTEDPDDPNLPEHDMHLLVDPAGRTRLRFMRVPEAKAGKNRVHLDLAPTDRRRDEEVERLLGIGARLIDDRREPDGTGLAVLADPEGNEFCVERSDAERRQT